LRLVADSVRFRTNNQSYLSVFVDRFVLFEKSKTCGVAKVVLSIHIYTVRTFAPVTIDIKMIYTSSSTNPVGQWTCTLATMYQGHL
jgi:hypothetical protein